jgi:hypothetical protein
MVVEGPRLGGEGDTGIRRSRRRSTDRSLWHSRTVTNRASEGLLQLLGGGERAFSGSLRVGVADGRIRVRQPGEHTTGVCLSALAAVLFGYDNGIFGAALLCIPRDLPLTHWQKGAVVSATVFGAMLGTPKGQHDHQPRPVWCELKRRAAAA